MRKLWLETIGGVRTFCFRLNRRQLRLTQRMGAVCSAIATGSLRLCGETG